MGKENCVCAITADAPVDAIVTNFIKYNHHSIHSVRCPFESRPVD